MEANEIYLGDTRRLECRFYDFDGVATDPTTVTVRHKDPSGNITTPAAVNDPDEVGLFYYDLITDEAGIWQFSFEGTGNGVDRIAFGSFNCLARPF